MREEEGRSPPRAEVRGFHRLILMNDFPEPATYEEALDCTLAGLRSILISKHQDYGPENILHFGEYGIVMRVQDKVSRLERLVPPKGYAWPNRAVREETVDDTWIDLVNYAVIALMLRNGIFTLPMASKPDTTQPCVYASKTGVPV